MSHVIDILLIEDEPNIAEAVRFILSRDGWSLAHWHEGGEALSQIAHLRPKLIVLDVMLPARSGLEVLEALRADHALRHLPVLMLTARGMSGRGGISSSKADRVLAKPFDNDELRRIVRDMLGAPR
ncbi:Response regulator receiver domain-containing protein [Paracoccus isoporae]|uniref:Response regulator receiver domain-containing protein n=1 Tax=Paracoccus isoporae TaxID=591205 RepID=A0A1G6THS3_9RHOB|nr:response regulator [Paracoccus isoporae]SDD28638.1 Response regulator receiver domain-containing protein [Paracoccus isoporae]